MLSYLPCTSQPSAIWLLFPSHYWKCSLMVTVASYLSNECFSFPPESSPLGFQDASLIQRSSRSLFLLTLLQWILFLWPFLKNCDFSQIVTLLSHDSKPHHHYDHDHPYNLSTSMVLFPFLRPSVLLHGLQQTNTNSLSYIQIIRSIPASLNSYHIVHSTNIH